MPQGTDQSRAVATIRKHSVASLARAARAAQIVGVIALAGAVTSCAVAHDRLGARSIIAALALGAVALASLVVWATTTTYAKARSVVDHIEGDDLRESDIVALGSLPRERGLRALRAELERNELTGCATAERFELRYVVRCDDAEGTASGADDGGGGGGDDGSDSDSDDGGGAPADAKAAARARRRQQRSEALALHADEASARVDTLLAGLGDTKSVRALDVCIEDSRGVGCRVVVDAERADVRVGVGADDEVDSPLARLVRRVASLAPLADIEAVARRVGPPAVAAAAGDADADAADDDDSDADATAVLARLSISARELNAVDLSSAEPRRLLDALGIERHTG